MPLHRGPLRRLVTASRTLLGLALGLIVHGLAASEEPQLSMELNKLEQQDGACAAYVVFGNDLPARFEALKLELVFFDNEGLIQRRLTLDAAPLPGAKTMVKLFKVPNMRCDSLGRILVNDVIRCEGEDGPVEHCLDRLSVSFRGTVELIK